jgi:hypothetical protein
MKHRVLLDVTADGDAEEVLLMAVVLSTAMARSAAIRAGRTPNDRLPEVVSRAVVKCSVTEVVRDRRSE